MKASICQEVTAILSVSGVSGRWVNDDQITGLGKVKGAYLLLLKLPVDERIALPKVGSVTVEPGWYLYTGSARGGGGIAARLKRHFLHEKKIHWHIDKLTTKAAEITAFVVEAGSECALADYLLQSGRYQTAITGFGSTDCKSCESHLLKLVI